MAPPNGTLGQLVIQILMDRTAYQAAANGLKQDAKQTGAALGKAGSDGAKGMDELGSHASSARREIAVMIHELATGNIQNFEGSLLVLGERLDILSKLFSPVGLGIAAFLAGVAALGIGAIKGAEQQEAFNKAIQATAGYAGVNVGQLNLMAERLEALGVPASKTGAALDQIVASGKVGGSALESVALASATLSEATGQDTKQIVQQFTDMSSNVADGAAKMSEQYHFLTAAQYDEIKALQEHGDQAGAMKLAADSLTSSLDGMKVPLGTLPKLLHDGADAWNEFWQAAMNAGKPDTPASVLEETKTQIAQTTASLNAEGSLGLLNLLPGVSKAQRGVLSDLQGEVAGQQRDADLHADSSAIQGYLKELQQGGLDASRSVDKLSESLDKNYAKSKALSDLSKQYAAMWSDPSDPNHANPRLQGVSQNADGSFSGGRYASLVKGVNDRYKDHDADATSKASLQQQVDAVRQALNQINNEYRNSESVLEASHNAGTISDADYYQTQRDQIAKAANDQAAQLEREIGILQQHKASGAEQVQINKQIQDAEQQLQKVRDDTAANFQKNVAQERAAAQKRKATLDEFKGALDQQLATQQNRVDIQVASVGMGSQEASQAQQLNSLQRSYDSQRTRIAASMAKVSPDSDAYALYQSQLADLQDANDKAVAITTNGFARMKVAQGDWTNGAIQAWQNFQDQAANVASGMSQTFSDAFSGLTNDLVTFVTTGRTSFSGLLTTVETDLARMALRSAESGLFSTALSFFNIGTAPVARAGGGSVWGAGSATSDSIPARLSDGEFVVRAAVASKPGVRSFLSALNSGASVSGGNRFANGGSVGAASGGSDGTAVQINVSTTVEAPPAASSQQTVTPQQLATQVNAIVKQRLAKETQQGGIFWRYRNNA